jgi:hypothetical protein
MKKIDELLGRIIVLKNENDVEIFKIVDAVNEDYVLEKINPIVIDEAQEIRKYFK